MILEPKNEAVTRKVCARILDRCKTRSSNLHREEYEYAQYDAVRQSLFSGKSLLRSNSAALLASKVAATEREESH